MSERDAIETYTAEAAEQGGQGRGLRLDVFWFERLQAKGLSRGRIQEWIKAGRATVNGVVCAKPSLRLTGAESLALSPERLREGPEPEDGGLHLVYEDEHVAVVNKPPGLTVHPAPSCPDGTLVNRLAHRFPQLALLDAERPGIVHRIDKDTSGLLLTALTEAAKNRLCEDFAQRRVDKTYLALAWGCPERSTGQIIAPIGRDPKNKTKMAVVAKGGRPAQSEYKVVWRAPQGRACLLEIGIATGRTHQIRVHMAHLGHPLVGDAVYGPHQVTALKRLGGPLARLAQRQMLHAWKLSFTHPATGERLRFTLPTPKDFWRTALLLNRQTQRAAVTGMAGSGKTAFCGFLEQAGFPVFSADAAVTDLYQPGEDGHAFIQSRYGDRFLDEQGLVDRSALFRAMASSEQFHREFLELIHPLVFGRVQAFFDARQDARAAFAEIPLLFEGGWHERGFFDAVIGVRANDAARARRLALGRGWSEETAATMDSWQWPQEKKMAQCALVAKNVGDLAALAKEAKRILHALQDMRRKKNRVLLSWMRAQGYVEPLG